MANAFTGLRSVDLNLLPILQALLSEGSVTRAAGRLGLSQPATSQALTRLRHLLGDPLLIKVGRTMRLTPRAEMLRPELERACSAVAGVLVKTDFRPEQTKREFIVSSPDYFALMLGPPLMQVFSEQAPGVSVRFIDVPVNLHDRIASGEIDVSAMLRIDALVQGLCMQAGYMDQLVMVVAADHPLAAKPPQTLAGYQAYPYLGLHSDLATPARLKGPHRELGGPHGNVTLTASNMLLLPLIASRSRAFAMIPRTLAEQAARLAPLVIFDLPLEVQVRPENCLLWSPIHDADPAHAWFRGVLDRAMRLYFERDDNTPPRTSRTKRSIAAF